MNRKEGRNEGRLRWVGAILLAALAGGYFVPGVSAGTPHFATPNEKDVEDSSSGSSPSGGNCNNYGVQVVVGSYTCKVQYCFQAGGTGAGAGAGAGAGTNGGEVGAGASAGASTHNECHQHLDSWRGV